MWRGRAMRWGWTSMARRGRCCVCCCLAALISVSLMLFDTLLVTPGRVEPIASSDYHLLTSAHLQQVLPLLKNPPSSSSASFSSPFSMAEQQSRSIPHQTSPISPSIQKMSTPVPSAKTASLVRQGGDIALGDDVCPESTASKTKKDGISKTCPDVLIVGARKGGTTSLYRYLSYHPDFAGIRLDWGPMTGETWYFSQWFSLKGLQEYLDLFNSSNERMTGEATVDYLVNCNVPKRVIRVCKNLPKVIMLLRDPVDRLVSNFHMRIAMHKRELYVAFNKNYSISRTINQEMRKFLSRLKQAKVDLNNIQKGWTNMRCLFREAKNLVHEGAYFVHVMNWLCSYPKDKILVLNSEQFFDTPEVVMSEVFNFLGLRMLSFRELQNSTAVVHNKGQYSSAARHQLGSFEKKKLSQLYRPFNQALFELLNWTEVQWT